MRNGYPVQNYLLYVPISKQSGEAKTVQCFNPVHLLHFQIIYLLFIGPGIIVIYQLVNPIKNTGLVSSRSSVSITSNSDITHGNLDILNFCGHTPAHV
jgi:hypothetical protein